MVRKLEGERLEAWLTAVAERGIEELQRFANGLQQDKAAVLMGLTHSHNNAQAEGQVTRIKLIKRMMYGRAGFSLVASARFAPLLRELARLNKLHLLKGVLLSRSLEFFLAFYKPVKLDRLQKRRFLVLRNWDRISRRRGF